MSDRKTFYMAGFHAVIDVVAWQPNGAPPQRRHASFGLESDRLSTHRDAPDCAEGNKGH
jgi:hypothetical protein